MTDANDGKDNARSQAKAQFDSIREMVDNLRNATDPDYETIARKAGWTIRPAEKDSDECVVRGTTPKDPEYAAGFKYAEDWQEACETDELILSEDDARQRIEEDALSVEVRSDWYPASDSSTSHAPAEYRILLCTGGPAVQIVGDLDQYCEPAAAAIQYQDWFTPWTEWRGEDVPEDAEEILLEYARCFWFGE